MAVEGFAVGDGDGADPMLGIGAGSYETHSAQLGAGDAVVAYTDGLIEHKSQVADALLAVTDHKAQKASGAIRGAYDKLRPMAKKQVEAAAPRLAAMLERHAAPTT